MQLEEYKERVSRFFDRIVDAAASFRASIPSSNKVVAVKNNLCIEYLPTQVELDILKMKAIVLLKDASLGLDLKDLLQSPIEADAISLQEGKMEIHLSQRFELLGSKYRLEGRFRKPVANSSHSIPLTNTFKLVEEISV